MGGGDTGGAESGVGPEGRGEGRPLGDIGTRSERTEEGRGIGAPSKNEGAAARGVDGLVAELQQRIKELQDNLSARDTEVSLLKTKHEADLAALKANILYKVRPGGLAP